ncbi:TRAP ABC transporter substrate-binding protein [Kocuria flava]|uniref:C4-dicarboxylate ABC transporter n=1 Tax=Kocuria flava TaxID=446860 RepID=A0A0U2WQH4_9MICC|nr:TAXI family TRAP transporter solute-binding subunit [Kocuria flava]ALU38772.1 TRAP ABC transporter substrate-binding protein [Kocuria flava]GEO91990.1 C4-dicarboxylate ABC transporter [Kocuria flava]
MIRTSGRIPRLATLGAAAALGLSGCTPATSDDGRAGANGLPQQLVWSTYNVGTGTYNDLAAVANALTGEEGVQVRLMTADTGIGRLAPLVNGTVDYSRAGDEYYYAYEGLYEFASPEWGPQDLRMVWAPLGNYGLLVREDSGIDSYEDLEGKRFPVLTASTSINNKMEGFLNYGGLTWDDVEQVPISYGEQIAGLESGQIDALYQNVVGSNIEELASTHDVTWLSLDDPDPARYGTWDELMPMVTVGEVTGGAGMAEGESARVLEYTIPLTTTGERDADEVHHLVRAIVENYEHYAGTTPDAEQFHLEKVLKEPLVVPFHEGTVRYFEERGVWTEELERKNQELIERGERMREAWPGVVEASGEEDLAANWEAWKATELDGPGGPAEGTKDEGTDDED